MKGSDRAAGRGRPGGAGQAGARNSAPLIAHVIYRLDLGGMENGLVNIINRTPHDRYRHVVICLKDFTSFRARIVRDDVEVFALGRREGKDLSVYFKLWRLLRRLRPDIVHTRNLPAVDMVVPAFLAGARHRVHSEHGRDVLELTGQNFKYNLLRRVLSPLVHQQIAMSRDLADWLHRGIGLSEDQIVQIYNGVDTERFHPAEAGRTPLMPKRFAPEGALVIGTVGRMEAVKDSLTLVRAFLNLVNRSAAARNRLRLLLVGEGSLRSQALAMLEAAGAGDLAWLPGARDDVPQVLRAMDIFVLPSLNEGISNTILEAMACGLPVVATDVGGNPELVIDGETGVLVPPGAPPALAEALQALIDQPDLIRGLGRAGRARVERDFGLDPMVDRYLAVYDDLLSRSSSGLRGLLRPRKLGAGAVETEGSCASGPPVARPD